MNKNRLIRSALCLALTFAMTFTPIFSSYAIIATAAGTGEEQATELEDTNTNEEAVQEETTSEPEAESVKDQTQESPKADEQTVKEEQSEKTEAVEEKANKTEYVWKDEKVKVTAKLSDAAAIPDDAELVATLITEENKDYDYNAFIEAYEKQNKCVVDTESSLLYDISFTVDGTEIEPAKGTVAITFDFLDSQITEKLGACNANEVIVTHLPIKVDEKTDDSSVDSSSLSSDDIEVEQIASKTSISKETIDFTLSSFSAVLITTENGVDYYEAEDISSRVNYNTIMGRGVEYGIVADTYYQNNHTQTNFAVKTYDRNGEQVVEADLSGAGAVPFIVGTITDGNELRFGGSTSDGTKTRYDITTSDKYKAEYEADVQRHIETGNNSMSLGPFHLDNFNTLTVNPTFLPQSTVESAMNSMIQHLEDESDLLKAKDPTIVVPDSAISDLNHYTIDTTRYAQDAVIYINVPEGSRLAQVIEKQEGLNVRKYSDQTVVFNLYGSKIDMKKFAVTVADQNDKYITSNTSQSKTDDHNDDVDNEMVRKIVWNMPDATEVSINTCAGLFLIPKPNAVTKVEGSSAGWLGTGGRVENHNAEWHFTFKGRQYNANNKIRYSGRKELYDSENKLIDLGGRTFTFDLFESNENWELGRVIESKQNDSTSKVSFSYLGITEADFDYSAGTESQYYDSTTGTWRRDFYYVVKEQNAGQNINGISYWSGELDIKLTAILAGGSIDSDGQEQLHISYVMNSWKYSSDEKRTDDDKYRHNENVDVVGDEFTFGAFPNTMKSDDSVDFKGIKTLENKTLEDKQFEFVLTEVDENGNPLTGGKAYSETVKNSGTEGKITFSSIKYTAANVGTHYYTVKEKSTSGNGITVDKTVYNVTVAVTETDDGEIHAVASNIATSLNFKNTYTASTEATVEVGKSLEGADLTKDQFSFTITPVTEKAPMPEDSTTVTDEDGTNTTSKTVANDASGKVDFGKITYNQNDSEKTYVYRIVEDPIDPSANPNITQDTTTGPAEIYAKVVVGKDNGDGTMDECTVSYYKDADCTEPLTDTHFINKYTEEKGKITVNKSLGSGAPEEASTKTYEFTVMKKDSNPAQYVQADGSLGADPHKFTVQVGTPKTIENMPLGDYVVTEDKTSAAITGYTLAVTGEGEVTATKDGGTKTLTNTYTEEKGKITVSKSLGSGAPEEASTKTYEFTVMKKGSNPAQYVQADGSLGADPHKFTVQVGTPKTIENMPLGDYVVTEDKTSAAITGYTLAVSGEGNVTATKEGATKALTNTYTEDKGSLTVTKTWEGDDSKLTQDQKNAVTFTVSGPNGYSAEFTYGQMTDGSKTLDDLSLGEYTVTESNKNVEGFTISTVYKVGDSETGTAVISSNGDSKTVDVTNNVTELKGKLVLTKSWTGDTSELTDEYKNAIAFTVTGPDGYRKNIKFSKFTDNSYEIENLTPGEYTVVESNESLDGYEVTKTYKVGDEETGTIQLTKNGGTVNVTNDYNKLEGELTVAKTWSGDHAKLTEAQKNAVSFTVTGPNNYNETFTYGDMTGGSKKLEHLPLGEYTVTESNANYDGFTVATTYSVEDGKTEIKDGENSTVTVTNDVTQLKGKLVLTKNWTGDTSELTDEYKNAIKFTVTGPNGYSNEISYSAFTRDRYGIDNLTPGEYTVVESNETLDGYVVTKTYAVGDEATGTIQLTYRGGTVEVTNNYNKLEGELTVTKTWSGDYDKLTQAQKNAVTFTVTGPEGFETQTFTYGDMTGGSKKLEHLPLGEYTVTESNASYDGFTVTKTYSVTDGKVEIKDGDKKTVEVTNAVRQDKGSLTVTKTWTGDDSKLTQAQKNAVTFTVTGPNNYKETFTYGQMSNGSKTLSDLILGDYTVTESNTEVDGFVISTVYKVGDSETGTAKISEHGEVKTVAVTNNVTQLKGKLVLTKSWTGDTSELTDTYKNAIEFTVTGPDNYSKTIKFSEFTDNSYEIENLTPGEYTVVESNESLDGYEVTKTYKVGDKETGTIQLTKNGGAVNVTNDYNKLEGELTVTKTWSGDHAKLTEAQKNAVTFTVTGPEGFEVQTFTYGHMTGGSKKLEHLPLGEYTVTESNATYPGYEVKTSYKVGASSTNKATLEDGDSKTVEVTNAVTENKGSFNLQKNVTVNGEAVTADDYKLVDGDYNFNLYKVEGDKETKVKTVKLTIKDGKSETTEVDELDAGSYVIEEVVPSDSEFRIMGESSRQNVTVTPSGIGTVPTVEFTNNYARTSIGLKGTKSLQNGDIKEYPAFEFSLYDKSEYEKSKDQNILLAALDPLEPVSTASSGDDGKFEFDKIEYELKDLKTDDQLVNEKVFEYVAIENVPDTAVEVTIDGQNYFYDKENDILYDPTEIDVAVKVTYDPQTGKMTAVTQPETISLVFVNKKMYTKLSLTKSIDAFIAGDTDGEKVNATLVFRLTYADPITGKTVNRDVSVQFDKDNVTSQTVEVEKIPIDTTVEVKEIYSSNYKPTDPVTATKGKDKDGYPVWTVSLDNEQVGTTTGSGIINNVQKSADGSYNWNVGETPKEEPKN